MSASNFYRPPIPPQSVLRNASTFASANPTRQNAATVAESAGRLTHFPYGGRVRPLASVDEVLALRPELKSEA